MISNLLTATFEDLTSDNCILLADYFDAQAAELRRTASTKNKDIEHKILSQKKHVEKHKKLLQAGAMALELVQNNVEKSISCGRAATVFRLPIEQVTANFEIQRRKFKMIQIETRKEKTLQLTAKGFSVRDISERLGCSKSTIHNIIKNN